MRANREFLFLAMARVCIGTKELAEMAELPRPTLNNVVSGRNVRPETLGKVAKALGVDPAELVERE